MPNSASVSQLTWTLGAQVIGVATIASPAYAGRTLREGYLTQPMLMGTLSALGGRFGLHGMLDLEGITLERGELTAGMHGEGYVDRRHPHTYLHELVASATAAVSRSRVSLSVGRGFVPFGTDDPMVRPFEKYPANHHIAQIVERLLATLAVGQGPFLLEAARFNGDEPETPGDMPNGSRLWDSWAGRASVAPAAGVEMQASVARVKSPELARGGGLDQRKVNLSLRFENEPAMGMTMGHAGTTDPKMEMTGGRGDRWRRYALVEWGRSSDYNGSAHAFSFTTMLAEVEVGRGDVAFAARLERTERPEEERPAGPFRTQRPSTDFNILGRTRWDIASARLSANAYRWRWGALAPFVEVARQHVKGLDYQQLFDPENFYGSDTLWSYSAGVRISAGMIHRRTGRYGAAGMEGSATAGSGTVRAAPVSETSPAP